ncbi:hypothetical protein [Bacillus sonorensis]|uniref:hypothetical protein n=1 Tax=Bacillus sonorensis TaxID=119858 RepID=UPI00098B8066|nr:hypothetical protein [Bacillus sonorensis]
MNLSEELKKQEKLIQKGVYTVRGNIVPLEDGVVKIEFSPYAYALVNEKDIDPSLVFPLTSGEDPSGRESKHAIKLLEGTTIELHVKSLVHTFTMAKSTLPFYIDEFKEEVVYLNTNHKNESNPCYKYVYIVDCHCCEGGYLETCYGWVGCGSGWYDKDCCPDISD